MLYLRFHFATFLRLILIANDLKMIFTTSYLVFKGQSSAHPPLALLKISLNLSGFLYDLGLRLQAHLPHVHLPALLLARSGPLRNYEKHFFANRDVLLRRRGLILGHHNQRFSFACCDSSGANDQHYFAKGASLSSS